MYSKQLSPSNILNDNLEALVAIGNPEQHVRKPSHCGSKQQ